MPSNNDKYKDEDLVCEAIALRELHMQLKDRIHDPKVRHQTKIPSRKEMISSGTVYTKLKGYALRLAKARDKKEDKASGKSSGSKLRVVRVDSTLSTFLRLKERNLPVDMYPDTLVTSYFTDWVVRSGLQKGKEVLLTGSPGREFIDLFGDDLKKLGSGPLIKANNIDPRTGKVVLVDTPTAVLDADGKQINPFNMNKHMHIFASHYPQVPKKVNGHYEKGREVISRDEYPKVYEQMQSEHTLFTVHIGNARRRYRALQDRLLSLQEKKAMALEVGDSTITDSIAEASHELRLAKQEYISLLNENNITHHITL